MILDSYTVDVLTGVARRFHELGIGRYEAHGDVYEPDSLDNAIVFSAMPASPARAICITRYGDDPGILGTNTVMLQIKSRVSTNPLEGEAMVDAIRDNLHRKTNVDLGGHRFNSILQKSFGPLGRDKAGLWTYSQNFQLVGMR